MTENGFYVCACVKIVDVSYVCLAKIKVTLGYSSWADSTFTAPRRMAGKVDQSGKALVRTKLMWLRKSAG